MFATSTRSLCVVAWSHCCQINIRLIFFYSFVVKHWNSVHAQQIQVLGNNLFFFFVPVVFLVETFFSSYLFYIVENLIAVLIEFLNSDFLI